MTDGQAQRIYRAQKPVDDLDYKIMDAKKRVAEAQRTLAALQAKRDEAQKRNRAVREQIFAEMFPGKTLSG